MASGFRGRVFLCSVSSKAGHCRCRKGGAGLCCNPRGRVQPNLPYRGSWQILPTPESALSGRRKSFCLGELEEEAKYQLVISHCRNPSHAPCPLFSPMTLTLLQLRRRSFKLVTVSYRKVQSNHVNRHEVTTCSVSRMVLGTVGKG